MDDLAHALDLAHRVDREARGRAAAGQRDLAADALERLAERVRRPVHQVDLLPRAFEFHADSRWKSRAPPRASGAPAPPRPIAARLGAGARGGGSGARGGAGAAAAGFGAGFSSASASARSRSSSACPGDAASPRATAARALPRLPSAT